jgi:hypothetical protein
MATETTPMLSCDNTRNDIGTQQPSLRRHDPGTLTVHWRDVGSGMVIRYGRRSFRNQIEPAGDLFPRRLHSGSVPTPKRAGVVTDRLWSALGGVIAAGQCAQCTLRSPASITPVDALATPTRWRRSPPSSAVQGVSAIATPPTRPSGCRGCCTRRDHPRVSQARRTSCYRPGDAPSRSP